MNPKELQPDGNGGHLWKGSSDRFQGYTAKALEVLQEDVKEIKAMNEKQWSIITGNRSRLDVMKGQAMTRAMVVSAIVSVVLLFVGWIVTNFDKLIKP